MIVILTLYLNIKYFFRIANPFYLDPGWREKINWNFYFNTSLWCLHWDTTNKCYNKNLSYFLFQHNFMKSTGWQRLRTQEQIFNQKPIQNPVKHTGWGFLQKILLKLVNYFPKRLHFRYLTEFSVYVCFPSRKNHC